MKHKDRGDGSPYAVRHLRYPCLAGALIACSAGASTPVRSPAAVAPQAPAERAQRSASLEGARDEWRPTADGAIGWAVEYRLARNFGLPRQHLQVAVSAGVVTLSGELESSAQICRAVELAEQTRGVMAVVNLLRATGIRPDAQILQEVQAALDAASGDLHDVRVSVVRGGVVLRGDVGSLAAKERAARAAWSVYGVSGVDDQLRVVPSDHRSDEQIAEDVKQLIGGDSYLFGQPVHVSVKDGVVALAGKVDTLFARRRVLGYANVPGARAVEASELVVQQQPQGSSTAAVPSSKSIEQAVLHAFALDPRVPENRIEVHVDAQRGELSLSGVVATLGQKRAAGEDALNATGIWMVQNLLLVRPTAPFTDREVEQRVRDRLMAHPYVDARRVDVAATKGIVVISGHVDDAFQRGEAARIASLVPGVIDVENRLTYGPRDEIAPGRSDEALRRELLRELDGDSRIDSSLLDVRVERGQVTISGRLRSWEERNAVLEDVFEVAPRSFIDRLEVRQFPRLVQP